MNFMSESTGIIRTDRMQYTISTFPVPDLHMAILPVATGFFFPQISVLLEAHYSLRINILPGNLFLLETQY